MTNAQLGILRDLSRLWDEFAVNNSKEPFQIRFFQELEKLNRFQVDFPDKSPALPFKALEIKVIHTFRQEFPADEILKALPRLLQFEQGTFP